MTESYSRKHVARGEQLSKLPTERGPEELNLVDNMTQYCVSTLTYQVAQTALDQMVQSWNAHRIHSLYY